MLLLLLSGRLSSTVNRSISSLAVSTAKQHDWDLNLLHCAVQEAKQLEEARLKLAKEQKKKQDMEAAARLAAQRRTAEQAARQQVEAEMQKKRVDRQSRVCHLLVPVTLSCTVYTEGIYTGSGVTNW